MANRAVRVACGAPRRIGTWITQQRATHVRVDQRRRHRRVQRHLADDFVEHEVTPAWRRRRRVKHSPVAASRVPDVHMAAEDVFASGTKVVARVRYTGKTAASSWACQQRARGSMSAHRHVPLRRRRSGARALGVIDSLARCSSSALFGELSRLTLRGAAVRSARHTPAACADGRRPSPQPSYTGRCLVTCYLGVLRPGARTASNESAGLRGASRSNGARPNCS